ncbi:MAG: hypothetical protein NVS4B1_04700 [Ktedonobacteraceae bacterium]
MPVLAGWLTGEQVPLETIEQILRIMEQVLGSHSGNPARIVQPGMGLVTFSDSAYAMQHNDEPPVLDWVPDRRTFVYRRPLSGAHVLYYVEDWPAQGNLLFASEIKALLAVGVTRELRFAALDALLNFGFIPAPWTAFKRISVVPAGSLLRWQHAKTVVNHAVDFRFATASDAVAKYSQEDIVEQLDTLLAENTKALLPLHEQLVAFIYGDAASALPALLASQQTEVPFTTISFDYKHARLDVKIDALRIANACYRPLLTVAGVDQPEFWLATLAGLESPCVDTRPLALHQLSHTVAAETGARVALSGLGASTIFGRHRASTKEVTNSIFSQEAQQKIQQEEQWKDSLHARKLERQVGKFESEQQKQYYLDLHLYMPDGEVGIAHQLAMQEGMVIRSPYLRSDVLEMLTSLNDEVRCETLLPLLVVKHFPSLENIQTFRALKFPVPSLLHVDASELLEKTLSREAIQVTGIFDIERVEKLLRQKKVSRELVMVFTTQLFCRLFEMEV